MARPRSTKGRLPVISQQRGLSAANGDTPTHTGNPNEVSIVSHRGAEADEADEARFALATTHGLAGGRFAVAR